MGFWGYVDRIKKAVLIGNVADIILEAEHDNSLTEKDVDELTMYADERINEIGGA